MTKLTEDISRLFVFKMQISSGSSQNKQNTTDNSRGELYKDYSSHCRYNACPSIQIAVSFFQFRFQFLVLVEQIR